MRDKGQIITAIIVLFIVIAGVLWLRQRSMPTPPNIPEESSLSPSFDNLFSNPSPNPSGSLNPSQSQNPNTVTKEFSVTGKVDAMATAQFTKEDGFVNLSITANLEESSSPYSLWGKEATGEWQKIGELIVSKAGYILETRLSPSLNYSSYSIAQDEKPDSTKPGQVVLELSL